jgi:hypothetical protein
MNRTYFIKRINYKKTRIFIGATKRGIYFLPSFKLIKAMSDYWTMSFSFIILEIDIFFFKD